MVAASSTSFTFHYLPDYQPSLDCCLTELDTRYTICGGGGSGKARKKKVNE